MRVFIDLGAFTGDTLEIALKRYKGFDRFYAFEPLVKNFEILKKKFGDRENVYLVNAAADTEARKAKFYLGNEWGDEGGSLCDNKTTCFKDKFENVTCLDFSKFVTENFSLKDKIILKVDIEGKEYDLFKYMIKENSISYIDKIYCEWHNDRIGLDYGKHRELIRQLRKRGFNLVGDNSLDEYTYVSTMNNVKLQIKRYKFYYAQEFKNYVRTKHPGLYSLLKSY